MVVGSREALWTMRYSLHTSHIYTHRHVQGEAELRALLRSHLCTVAVATPAARLCARAGAHAPAPAYPSPRSTSSIYQTEGLSRHCCPTPDREVYAAACEAVAWVGLVAVWEARDVRKCRTKKLSMYCGGALFSRFRRCKE